MESELTSSYLWTFPALDVAPGSDGIENIVTGVHWRLRVEDAGYTAEAYGCVALPPPGPSFVSYSELTPAIVQGWVEQVLGEARVDEIKSSLSGQLAGLISNAATQRVPPWVPVETDDDPSLVE